MTAPSAPSECPNCRQLRRRLDQLELGLARLEAFMNVARRGIGVDDPEEFRLLRAEIDLLESEIE